MKEDTFNLSEYYDSILTDPDNAIVLAWIEKSGFTSEDAICQEVAFDPKKVKNIIVKLYKNRLIELNKSFFQTSLKGKRVIDTLKISNEIVKSHYSTVDLNENEELFYSNSINHYRHYYYGSYLNTCKSVNIWNRFNKIEKPDNNRNTSIQQAVLVVFLYDLLNAFENDSSNFENDNFRAYFDEIRENSSINAPNLHNTINMLSEIYSIKSLKDFGNFDEEKKNVFKFIYFKNQLIDNDNFQNIYINSFKKLNDLDSKKIALRRNWIDELFPFEKLNFDLIKQYSSLSITSKWKDEGPFDTLLFMMENSENIVDFATKVNMSVDESTEILKKIQSRIDHLLIH